MKIIANDLITFHCPRWNELPEIDLYMDQVINILQNNLSLFAIGTDSCIITANMINNYVKKKIIPAPIKKKYNKEHLAPLFVICIFKRLMSISDIGESIKIMKNIYSTEEGYNIFCDELEIAIKSTFDCNYIENEMRFFESNSREIATLRAIVSAFAKSILVDRLILLREKKY